MTEEAEVQVKLTLDDAASKVADTIKGKFDKLSSVGKKLQGEFLSIAKGALSTAIGVNLAPGLQGITDSFKAMVDNAIDVQGHMRSVASYFVAGSDLAWDAAMNRSSQIDESLYKSSIAIGQNIDDARKAYQALAIQSDGTADSLMGAVKQTEKLLMFADVTGESVVGIADEWAMMEKGMVRTRGKLFKMLFSTKIFGDSLYNASTHWAKLTDEERTKRMAGAMNTITDRFAKAPQTMGSVVAGLDNVKQRLLDVVGMNVIGVLTAKFDNLLKSIEGKRPQLEAIASRFGKFLGKHIQTALDWAGEKLTWLEKNWDDVVQAAEDGAKEIYKAVKFIVQNKELILMAYGMNVMSPSIMMAMQTAPALMKMMKGLKLLSFTSLPAFTTSLHATTVAAGKAALKLGAMAIAAAATYAAFDQYTKLQKENKEEGGFTAAWKQMRYGGDRFSPSDVGAAQKGIGGAMKEGDLASVTKMIQDKLNAIENLKLAAHRKFGDDAAEHYQAMGITAMEKMVQNFEMKLPILEDQIEYSQITNAEQLVNAYNLAISNNDMASANYLANMTATSQVLATGLIENADMITGGMQEFMERLGTKARSIIEGLKAEVAPEKGKKPETKPPVTNFNGGQVFNIKQEFRESDPDRIALFFRRDLVRAATSRTRARVRTPFGA